MNIFVCVKQVPDTETKIIPGGNGQTIETKEIKWIMNPYDEYAVEQALKVKEKESDSIIILVRVGSVHESVEALRTGMAMGADKSILVEAPDDLDSYMTAKALRGAIEKTGVKPDLIFCGKQAIDDDCMQVPQILAQLMNFPAVTIVCAHECIDGRNIVKREIDGGAVETYEVANPCLFSLTKGINQPRYASLPGIMKAKKKMLENYTLSDVGVSESDRRIKYFDLTLPDEKPPGKKFDAMEEADVLGAVSTVVGLLRNEAKVI